MKKEVNCTEPCPSTRVPGFNLALQQGFPGLTLPHFLYRNKELASQDLARKLQRQLRDLREDFATTQQKETEANAKKNELVTTSLDFFSSKMVGEIKPGAQKLTGDNLKVVSAEFSTLS